MDKIQKHDTNVSIANKLLNLRSFLARASQHIFDLFNDEKIFLKYIDEENVDTTRENEQKEQRCDSKLTEQKDLKEDNKRIRKATSNNKQKEQLIALKITEEGYLAEDN